MTMSGEEKLKVGKERRVRCKKNSINIKKSGAGSSVDDATDGGETVCYNDNISSWERFKMFNLYDTRQQCSY